MAKKIKVYKPPTIEDQPFPQQEEGLDHGVSQTTGKGIYSQPKIKNERFPNLRRAKELISNSLNTISKKILGVFEFTPSGAIQIGSYEEDKTGDIKISPDGIVGRNKTGATTFAIDGETGDAVFKGDLRAGSVIAGDSSVVVDEVDGHGRILFYEGDKVAILLGWGDFS